MPYVNKPRPYKKEYEQYQGTEEQKKNRAMRNAARRKALREGKVTKGDGNDVAHIVNAQLICQGTYFADNQFADALLKARRPGCFAYLLQECGVNHNYDSVYLISNQIRAVKIPLFPVPVPLSY